MKNVLAIEAATLRGGCTLCKKPFENCACDEPIGFAPVVVTLTEAGRAALPSAH